MHTRFDIARRAFLLLCWLSLIVGSASTRAHAQANGGPDRYRALVEEAITEYEAHNFAEARSLFAKAAALYASARALRGVGMAEFELRQYGDSAEYLERALGSTIQPLTGELRVETERLLDRARGFVARVELALDPVSTAVRVDGGVVELLPGGVVMLEVGDHTLEFRAPGHVSETRTMKVFGGEQRTFRIALQPVRNQSVALNATAERPTADSDPRRPLYKNPWLWTGVGVAVAALATGLAVGLGRRDSDPQSIYPDETAIVGP